MVGFPQYGWKPALSSRALPKPFRASFDAGAAVHPFPAIYHYSALASLAEAELAPASMSKTEGCMQEFASSPRRRF